MQPGSAREARVCACAAASASVNLPGSAMSAPVTMSMSDSLCLNFGFVDRATAPPADRAPDDRGDQQSRDKHDQAVMPDAVQQRQYRLARFMTKPSEKRRPDCRRDEVERQELADRHARDADRHRADRAHTIDEAKAENEGDWPPFEQIERAHEQRLGGHP